ncbi:M48 family metallopeptidase [Aestuariivirga sp.]|uniref:M48 family metallopeptidase n=1 Tax=Aestuariivirga sp. TaxID=2650926 RepID=UPI0039E568F8
MAPALTTLRRLLAPKPIPPAELLLGETRIEVIFRRHASARRLVLRLNPEGTAAIVTVPKGVSRSAALDFAQRSEAWLVTRIAQRGTPIPLKAGSLIPLHGEDHEIRHIASRRGAVTFDPVARIIHVPGDLPHVPRRLTDWLKKAAKAELAAASDKYARAMGVSFRRITVRDQRSRWGSCSASGELSYSWRLILTPPYVLDYVAAHEVAHLKHMNHGPAFWRLVLSHCRDASRAKKWLKAHGHSVHRIST